MSRRFDVLFTKDGGKKRKVFHDGKLVVTLKTAATLPADDRNLGSDGVDGDGCNFLTNPSLT